MKGETMSEKKVVELPNGKEVREVEATAVVKRDIPLHVLTNLQEFLKRVTVTGMEAYALVEANGLLQEKIAEAQGAGVPFLGVPVSPGK